MQHHPRNYQTKALFVEKNILFHYWQFVNGVSMSAPGKHPSPAPPSDCRYPLSPLISIKLAPSSPALPNHHVNSIYFFDSFIIR